MRRELAPSTTMRAAVSGARPDSRSARARPSRSRGRDHEQIEGSRGARGERRRAGLDQLVYWRRRASISRSCARQRQQVRVGAPSTIKPPSPRCSSEGEHFSRLVCCAPARHLVFVRVDEVGNRPRARPRVFRHGSRPASGTSRPAVDAHTTGRKRSTAACTSASSSCSPGRDVIERRSAAVERGQAGFSPTRRRARCSAARSCRWLITSPSGRGFA